MHTLRHFSDDRQTVHIRIVPVNKLLTEETFDCRECLLWSSTVKRRNNRFVANDEQQHIIVVVVIAREGGRPISELFKCVSKQHSPFHHSLDMWYMSFNVIYCPRACHVNDLKPGSAGP